MSNEKQEFAPLKIKELKEFLNNLPEKFDDFGVINGEFNESDGDVYYRVERPVINVMVDENTEDLCLLHQSIEEIDDISVKDDKEETEKGD